MIEKIEKLITNKDYMGPRSGNVYFVQVGNAADYIPPPIVTEALKEVKIIQQACFPYKTEMRIYNNGAIVVGIDIFSANPNLKYYDLGKTHAEKIRNDSHLYQMVTKPVRVLSAPMPGFIWYYGQLTCVSKNDFLILCEDTHSVHALSNDKRNFTARIYDNERQMLSQESFKPGEALLHKTTTVIATKQPRF